MIVADIIYVQPARVVANAMHCLKLLMADSTQVHNDVSHSCWMGTKLPLALMMARFVCGILFRQFCHILQGQGADRVWLRRWYTLQWREAILRVIETLNCLGL